MGRKPFANYEKRKKVYLFMKSFNVLWGVLRYEFLMQLRRKTVWITFLCLGVVLFWWIRNWLGNPDLKVSSMSNWQLAATITLLSNWLAPLGIGILLADRLARDQRTRVQEVLETLPGSLSTRLWGKYLGTLLAALVPALLLFVLVMAEAAWVLQNWLLLPLGLLCYLLIVVPGVCFVSAFSLAVPAIMWVPLYQFLFFGYWFWGNLLAGSYGLPTLSGTILTPIGSFIAANLFQVHSDAGIKPMSPLVGVLGIVLLCTMAVLVIRAVQLFLTWKQTCQ